MPAQPHVPVLSAGVSVHWILTVRSLWLQVVDERLLDPTLGITLVDGNEAVGVCLSRMFVFVSVS